MSTQAPRLFVTGTGTGVGKTLVAAALVRALGADYWKPIQTGDDDDTATVRRLAGLAAEQAHAPNFSFKAPRSPHEAADLEDAAIDLDALRPPATDRPLIAEGAGGVRVPLAPAPGAPGQAVYMTDLMARLAYPVVLVAANVLGTINHTLLSLEALQARDLPVLGVVLNAGDMTSNKAAIEQFGKTRVLYEMPHLTQVDPVAIDSVARDMRYRLAEVV